MADRYPEPEPDALSDPQRVAPGGQPWCYFGVGLACRNRPCLNPAHRPAPPQPLDEEF